MYRAVPRSAIVGAFEHGVGLTAACMGMPVFGDMVADGSGLAPVGEVRLIPDASTLVRLPWCNGHAMALCDMLASPGAGGACWVQNPTAVHCVSAAEWLAGRCLLVLLVHAASCHLDNTMSEQRATA